MEWSNGSLFNISPWDDAVDAQDEYENQDWTIVLTQPQLLVTIILVFKGILIDGNRAFVGVIMKIVYIGVLAHRADYTCTPKPLYLLWTFADEKIRQYSPIIHMGDCRKYPRCNRILSAPPSTTLRQSIPDYRLSTLKLLRARQIRYQEQTTVIRQC